MKRSPDILWIFAAIFCAGLLFSAVSEGDSGGSAAAQPIVGFVAGR